MTLLQLQSSIELADKYKKAEIFLFARWKKAKPGERAEALYWGSQAARDRAKETAEFVRRRGGLLCIGHAEAIK